MTDQPINTGGPPRQQAQGDVVQALAAAQRQQPRPVYFESGSFRLFRLAGIDVWLHWSWFLVAYYQIQHRESDYSSPVWKVVEYLTLFGIVLLHEYGHALACRQVGGSANRIVLWPLGGIAFVSPPPRPGATLWSIAAGPLVNVLLAPLTIGLALLGWFQAWGSHVPDVQHFLVMIATINFGLLVFNLLPIYPLDGGQILRSLLWFIIGPARSLMAATAIGFVAGVGAIVLAAYHQSWWYGVLAVFAVWQSVVGFQIARRMLRVLMVPRRVGLSCPCCGHAPPCGPFWTCPQCRAAFDTFEHRAVCPNCGFQFAVTGCPDCGRPSPLAAWFGTTVTVQPNSPASEPTDC